MASPLKVAQRYSRAIFDYLGRPERVKSITEELKNFDRIVKEHAELKLALGTELAAEEERRAIIHDLSDRLELSQETLAILHVVSDAKRVAVLGLIVEQLHELLLESMRISPIYVESPQELDEEQQRQVEDRFRTLLGTDVEAHYEANGALIGGLRVTARGRTYDASLQGWLGSLEEKLLEGSI